MPTLIRTRRRPSILGSILLLLSLIGLPASAAWGQSFTSSGLSGESVNNPTSLQFGPDGRLYVSQQNGQIDVMTVERNGPSDYVVVGVEEIDLVQKYVPNHNDDGTPNSTQQRQVTGLVVAGTAANPVLYVSSSDWRIGAGGGGNDTGLDTNSGVISRLTWIGTDRNDPSGFWEKVDLVRGLPRSEENHSTNGLVLDGTTLLVAQGGHTNAGAPSNNFAFTTEYALSAAILAIDVAALDALPVQTDASLYADHTYQWVYDLPTLDDPTRDNVGGVNDPSANGYPTPGFTDPNDPFGGQDGLNQAKLVPGGPVQIHSPGYRNLYDLVLTEAGRLYGVDNGANGGWGGHPDGESDFPDEHQASASCTSDYLAGEPGSTGPGPGGDPQVNNKNGLHYVRDLQPGDYNYVAGQTPYYAGHPTPVRGNPAGAGLYTKGAHTVAPDGGDDFHRTQILDPADPNFSTQSLPVDWADVVPAANPVECDFRNSGATDGALANFGPSTNGITEYTASNLNGAYQGFLLAAGFNGTIYEIELSADGATAVNCPTFTDGQTLDNCTSSFASGFGASPLDIVAQGDADPFPGTVWAATYGADNITIFEPEDYDGGDIAICNGTDDPTLDEDGDFYTNADEIDNGTDPCSGASQPADFDDSFAGDFKDSNLLDPDDDDDGLSDTVDPFAWDASNGTDVSLPLRLDLFNSTSYGIGDIGFTGLMVNGTDDYLDLWVDNDDIIFGGTSGLLTIPAAVLSSGAPIDAQNSQTNAFQFGINVDASTPPFSITTAMEGPFFNGTDPVPNQAQGLQIGTGDQDNYLSLVLAATSGGPGVRLLYEEGGTTLISQEFSSIPDLLSNNVVQFRLLVDPAQGTVQPEVAYGSGEGDLTTSTLGTPVALTGNVLAAVQATHTVNGQPTALAVGPAATNLDAGSQNAFGATWDFFYVEELPSDASATVSVTPGAGINASTFANDSFTLENTSASASITSVSFDVSTAVLRDVVFDPNGTAGDNTAKDVTVGSESGGDGSVGLQTQSFSGARDGGFDVLTLPFADFEPGESIQFGVDLDPTSIQGTSAPGPSESGSISGLELSGAVVTVEFSDGTTHVTDLFGTAGSQSESAATALSPRPEAPGVGVQDVPLNTTGPFQTATVAESAQTIAVSAPAGTTVRLLQLEAGLFEESGSSGFDVDPFEANSVTAVSEQSAPVDGAGSVSFPVTLSAVDAVAGATTTFNHFVAVVENPDGTPGRASETVVLAYDPSIAPAPTVRINAGGPTITDPDLDWSASDAANYSGGSTYSTGNAIDVSQDPDAGPEALYQTEVYGGQNSPFTYTIPVSSTGPFDVKLHFAEIFQGVNNGNGAGSRVFDVSIEGTLFLDDYDVYAEAGGPLIAIVETATDITDVDNSGTIDLVFTASVDNAKISAIELLETGGPANEPPQVSPIADQTNDEGDSVSLAIAATDTDGPNNLEYSATGLPPGLSVEPTNGQIFGTISAGAAASSPYAVTASVTDGLATSTTSFQWTVNAPLPSTGVLYRVNAGGSELPASGDSDLVWGTDTEAAPSAFLAVPAGGTNTYSGSNSSAHSGDIVMTDPSLALSPGVPAELFNIERWDPLADPEMTYSFPVPESGTYVVRLFFAELFGQVTQAGQRVFDVSVEGTVPPELTGIDPVAIAGPKGAFIREVSVDVTVGTGTSVTDNGTLDVTFLHDVENPAIKGFEILRPSPDASPAMTVTVNPNSNLNASTYGNGSFTLTNTGDVPITQVAIDLSTAYLPDVVWDPEGGAGDSGAKCLTVSSTDAQTTGLLTPAPGTVHSGGVSCSDGFSVPHDNGYDVLTLDFSNFDPGESIGFAADIDPTSIQGDANTGDAGAISGMELIGSTVTTTFNGLATPLVAPLWSDGSDGGSQALVQPGPPAAPAIAVSGLTPPTATTEAEQTVELTGPADAPFELLHVDARLYIDDLVDPDNDGIPGFDIDPYEANEALAKQVYTGTFSSSGTASVPVTLLETAGSSGTPDGGLNHFVAVTQGSASVNGIQQTSPTSQVLVLELTDELPTFSVDVSVADGWNLVGLPAGVTDPSVEAVFPAAVSGTLFGFNGAYTTPNELVLGDGYWLQFDQSGTQTVSGTEQTSVEITLQTGWNLVSGPSCAIPLASLQDPDGVVVPGTFFGFAGAYTTPSSFTPGDGYWLQASAGGTVTLDCANAGPAALAAKQASPSSGLVFTDARGTQQTLLLNAPGAAAAYPVPPLPPEGSFDVRFDGDTRLLPAPEARIHVQAQHYPVAVDLRRPADAAAKAGADASNGTVYVDELVGGQVAASHVLAPSERITLTHAGAVLRIRTAEALPGAFQVRGNYPNPFRERTTLAVDVPEPATVTVEVYDLLGRRVMRLAPQAMHPGRQTLALDGRRLGAGIYFYRLHADMASGPVVETGRMTLVR